MFPVFSDVAGQQLLFVLTLIELLTQADLKCTPSVPAPTRRRRRPRQELKDLVKRCEDLLKQHAAGNLSSYNGQSRQASGLSDPVSTQASRFTPSTAGPNTHPNLSGKMIKEEGNIRFVDSHLWASVYEEVSGPSRL